MTTPKIKKSDIGKNVIVIHEMELSETSGVDVPAQEGARVLIRKRGSGDTSTEVKKSDDRDQIDRDNEEFAKAIYITTETDGHQHTFSDRGGEVVWGDTDFVEGRESDYHSHPWVRSDNGEIVLAAAEDHTHEVSEPLRKQAQERIEANMSKKNDTNVETNTELEDLKKGLEETKKELTFAKAWGELTDAEKTFAKTLSEDDRKTFATLELAKRNEMMSKAPDPDPVVFTAHDGTEFRKSAGSAMINIAKQNDLLIRQNREMTFRKRAETELPKLPGEDITKMALLEAVESIEDEAIRKSIGEMLAAANTSMSKAFVRAGENPTGNESNGDAFVKQAMEFAKSNKVSLAEAYRQLVHTDEGAAAYQQDTSTTH